MCLQKLGDITLRQRCKDRALRAWREGTQSSSTRTHHNLNLTAITNETDTPVTVMSQLTRILQLCFRLVPEYRPRAVDLES
jgi:hypothetical protein